MATKTIKARVEIDGEKQYKQALSELNSGNKVLASEMKKLQAEFKGNESSVEALTKKGELLERELLQQKDKVAVLKQALQDAASKYGEADKRTQSWQAQLNNAEAAQFDLEHAIQENNEALESQGEEMTGLGDTVEQLASKLGIQIPESAKNALNGMKGFSSGTVAAMAAAAAAVAGVIKICKELHQLTLQTAADVDEIATKSLITGVDTDTLQAWEYASQMIDVSVDTMTGSLTKLTQNMDKARDGNAELADTFSKLGISVTDSSGELRNSEEVFYEVIDALGMIENSAERDVVAMALFGKSGQELNPVIAEGSAALREMSAQAEELGYVLDEYQIKKLGEVDDTYQQLQVTIEAVRRQLAVDFAPASKEAMELFMSVVKKAGEMLERSGIIENLASILTSLVGIIGDVGQLVTSLPGLNTALDALRIALGAVAQFCAIIADTSDAITGILTGNWGQVKTALGWNYSQGQASRWQTTVMQQNGTYGEYMSWEGFGRNATGNDNWRGGLTWVGESGAELVSLPQGSQIYSAQDTREIMGGDSFYITIDAKSVKEFNDIIEVARNARLRERMR